MIRQTGPTAGRGRVCCHILLRYENRRLSFWPVRARRLCRSFMTRIESRENPRVKRVAKLLVSSAARREEGLFVCEGPTMLREAAAAGAGIAEVYALPGQEELLGGVDAPCFTVTEPVLRKLSDTEAPRGPVFTCRIPRQELPKGGQLIAVEDLRDPGNLGTVFRTAEALGSPEVVRVGSCADLYAPKTVRSTMGSIFRVKTCVMTPHELWQWTRERGVALIGAALSAGAQSIEKTDLRRACVLIGSEAHGLRPETLALCDTHAVIPIEGAESLNAAVAAAIFLWEMKRSRG